MGKIKTLTTSKNVECFPRVLNRQNPDDAYFIDSQRNTEPFKRLFTTPVAINAKVYPQYVSQISSVSFENANSFSMTQVMKSLADNHQVLEYECSGSVATMTTEQASAIGNGAIAGDTYCVIAYQTNFPEAVKYKAGWLVTAASAFESDATITNINANDITSSVLVLSGAASMTHNKQYYRVDVLKNDDSILCTYIWNLSAFITTNISAAKLKKTANDSATRTPVSSTSALSEVERLIQELKI